jgi:molecular chaperone GrpE
VTEARDIITEKPEEEQTGAGEEQKNIEEPVVSFVRETSAPPEQLAALQEELDKAKAQASEYLDGWQRARAELANARKRFEKERSEAGQLANGTLLRKILPVLDDLDRAMKTVSPDLQENSWVNGVALVQRKFLNALESEQVRPIQVKAGDKFDPQWHEAVTHEDAEDYKEGEIIAEVQKGYRYGDQVLRPALVRVAK